MQDNSLSREINPYQKHKYTIRETKSALKFMEKIIKIVDIGRLALNSKNYPYIIPMNHYYDSGCFYWHCSFVGKKLDLARKNKSACYIIDGPVKSKIGIYNNHRYNHDPWISILSYGKLEEIDDVKRRLYILNQYSMQQGGEPVVLSRAQTCNMLKLRVDMMTGRIGLFTPAEKRILLMWNFNIEL